MDFLTADGGQNAVSAIIGGYSSVYYNGRTYIAYLGAQYDIYIAAYVHATGAWEGPYWVVTGALGGADAHGTPYIHIDELGTIHLVGNCHVTALTYAKSSVAGDVSTMVVQTTPVASCSYPCIRQTSDNKLWLFYRTAGHLSPWAYKTSTDHGATWSAATNFLLFGQAANDTAYAYITKEPTADEFHISYCWQDENNSLLNPFNASTIVNRYNVYYFKMTAAGVNTRIDGSAVTTFPPTLASSNSELRILDTASGFNYSQVPVVCTDANKVPFLLVNIGNTPSTGIGHDYKVLWWNGSSISSSTITQTDYTLDEYNMELVSGTLAGGNVVLRAYLTAGGSPGTNGDFDVNQLDRGGSIAEWTSAAGIGSWSKTQDIAVAPSTTALYNTPCLVRNYQAVAKLAYNDWLTAVGGPYTAKVRLWGSGGNITVPFEAEATALLNRIASTPSAKRQSLINTTIRNLKAAGVWSNLDGFWELAAADAQSSMLNWISNNYNLTKSGTITQTTDLGWVSDGTTGYFDTGLALNTAGLKVTQNAAVFGLWMNTNSQSNNGDAGAVAGSTNVFICARSASDTASARLNQSTSIGGASTDSRQFTAYTRTTSTNMRFYKNRNAPSNIATVATAAPAATPTLTFGKVNGTAQFTTRSMGSMFIGGLLTDTQMTNLYLIMLAYKRQLGAV
jgi:hypothetical protein